MDYEINILSAEKVEVIGVPTEKDIPPFQLTFTGANAIEDARFFVRMKRANALTAQSTAFRTG